MDKIKLTNTSKTVLDSLREDHQISIEAACNGNGSCGKCKVRIIKGEVINIDGSNNKYLSDVDFDKGFRLACKIIPKDEITVDISSKHKDSNILTSHIGFNGKLNPLISKTNILIPEPNLKDQRDYLSRLFDSSKLENPKINYNIRKSLPYLLKSKISNLTISSHLNTITKIETGNNEINNFSIAYDLGTTTVVSYLINNITGEIIDTNSLLNCQKSFGADVISRIDYTINNSKGLDLLQKNIVSQLSLMAENILDVNNLNTNDLSYITIAGNTTMLHLLTGDNPEGIATAPFIPIYTDSLHISSSELLYFTSKCEVFILPSISAYVGSDIVAGILATSMDSDGDLSLLVDLGTNGELVLGNKEKLFCCATAAGPAFEGAHILFGSGAISGAVNSYIIGKENKVTTINNKQARSICGSGIVDVLSEFIKHQIIDETGRFNVDELKDDKMFLSDGEGSYIIVPGSETFDGVDITFTQKDIREVQLAKASIAAGIETLLHDSGVLRDSIKHLYIAGGFGNFININSAVNMGLIPKDFLSRSKAVGNTAGLGAINCALSLTQLEKCNDIVDKSEYIELSGNDFFQNRYIEEMMFE